MSTSTDILGPELEGLLREAAADPRSQLLRVPRPARVEGLLERQEVLRFSATGLTRLDRHLLAVYRAELADLLLRACTVLAFQDPSVRLRVYRDAYGGREREVATWDGLAESARGLQGEVGDLSIDADALVLVRAIAAGPLGVTSLTLTELALAAHRLQPSSSATAWVGFDQVMRGLNESAIRVLSQLLVSCPRLEVASVSLENLGLCYANQGRLDEAFRAYRRAFERDSDRTTGLVGWMHLAIQSGDFEEARAAGRILDSVVRTPSPGMVELLGNYERRLHGMGWSISAASRGVASRLASASGSVSGKVIDVYI